MSEFKVGDFVIDKNSGTIPTYHPWKIAETFDNTVALLVYVSGTFSGDGYLEVRLGLKSQLTVAPEAWLEKIPDILKNCS